MARGLVATMGSAGRLVTGTRVARGLAATTGSAAQLVTTTMLAQSW